MTPTIAELETYLENADALTDRHYALIDFWGWSLPDLPLPSREHCAQYESLSSQIRPMLAIGIPVARARSYECLALLCRRMALTLADDRSRLMVAYHRCQATDVRSHVSQWMAHNPIPPCPIMD